MKSILIFLLFATLTGCSAWSPIQKVTGENGSTYYWIAPLPSGDGTATSSRSAGVSYYYGTVNGRSYTVTSFK